MAKFKSGDIVGYLSRGVAGICGPRTYTHTDEHGRAWFSNGTWVAESRLFAWYCEDGVKNTACGANWDYAEAQRLQDVAKQAVKAYNEYISRKPETIFLKMPDY